jgi:DNA-directed RNA polymerase specialized sigma24 family protein
LTYHPDNDSSEFEDAVITQADTDRFLNGLSDTDRRIMTLRLEGRPLEEIAQLVGYKTHSAVLKRIRKIGKAYERYAREDLGFDAKKIT